MVLWVFEGHSVRPEQANTEMASEQKGAAVRLYTCGVKVPCKTHEGKAVNPAHMTVTFLGALGDEELKICTEEFSKLARSLRIRFGKPDVFGSADMIAAGKGIDVRLCDIVGDDDRKAVVDFHAKWGKAENGMPLLAEPNTHVSKRTIGAELDTMTEAVCVTWFIKQLGPHDPVFVKEL